MEKLGLYGGTFAPPHYGHIHAVKTFLEEVSLDRVLIMPTYQPPHKAKAAGDTPEVRLEMCRAAFGDIPGAEVSDYEIRKADVSYTVQTLEHLAAPDREIYLLCGTDMFLTLDRWYRAAEIFRQRLFEADFMPRISWEHFTSLMAAIRLGWLGEWVDMRDRELAERELEYIEMLSEF